MAFVGPRPYNKECCHYDGDATNNTIANLRWDTKKANQADKLRHGTSNRGERNGSAKLKEIDILEIRKQRGEGKTCYSIAQLFNVSITAIYNILSGRSWKNI